jgi:hypothetical protein
MMGGLSGTESSGSRTTRLNIVLPVTSGAANETDLLLFGHVAHIKGLRKPPEYNVSRQAARFAIEPDLASISTNMAKEEPLVSLAESPIRRRVYDAIYRTIRVRHLDGNDITNLWETVVQIKRTNEGIWRPTQQKHDKY